MELVILSDNYPSDRIPNKGVFVYNLIQELSHYHQISVIAPFRMHHLLKSKFIGGYGKERCKVYRPLYFSFSNRKILGLDTGAWSRYLMAKAVHRCLIRLPVKPDIIYAHFLSNALPGLSYVQKHSIPFVIASGESGYAVAHSERKKELQCLAENTSHIICVSETNKKGLVDLGFSENIMTLIPNAVDYDLFKPLHKETCKEKLGISSQKFVVGFVGNFIHRKGPNRIIEAIKQLNDKDIQLVCVGGKGGLTPNDFTKSIPPVPNYQLPEIYNAFDIFVLPTLSEGHCNAIEEAKACCIPVISSLGTSVETQIDKTTGILVNPLSIHEIAEAIQKLKNQPAARISMEKNLKLKIGEQSLKNRAQKISSLLTKTAKEN
ncbi:glycosyltransferase [Agriterribacter sp.]|uniref:glycosyltransferase n=1 Tax=Agriterribacter sp. TaxID=2821509 RepID=UPI002CA3F363|nr:glycosyltransferase [Agriterribacter sp.]HRO47706.1 glycosyltransferase [Agriterribacter sp.]HRQ18079.1 glycosyltransferase [Agriterribacter sp.]